MTITREQLEKAAKAARLPIEMDCEVNGYFAVGRDDNGDVDVWWKPTHDHGQLHDLAMACKICIDPYSNEIRYFAQGDFTPRRVKVDCQDFPALAEAVILAACEQWDAKGGSGV